MLSYDNVDYFNLSVEQASADFDTESVDSLDSATSDTGPGQHCEFEGDSVQFLLSLREEAMISQSALDKAIEGVDNLFSKFSNSIKDRILQGADATGSVPGDHIKNVFGEFSKGLFSGIDSKTSLDAFAKDNLRVLEPEPIELYSTDEWKDGSLNSVKHYAYVSPFLPSFKRLITRPDVLSCIQNPPEISEEGVYRGYRDGKHIREHPILSKEETVGVICAFDELEISSPLGPKKHKLALYFWTLANFSPHMRASLRSVQLLAIAWSKDLKDISIPSSASISLDMKYERHCKILAPFLEDIRGLEEGVQITVETKAIIITGSLLCVCGDTPAVNVLGGFKDEDSFEKRTAEKLEDQREDLKKSATQRIRHEKSTLYGINGPPVISNMIGFCPVLSFCYDLMRILHKCVLKVSIRFLIKYAVDVKEVITVDKINSDVKLMAHQLYSKDKPAPILQGHQNTGLRQSAAQMLSLALCIPFVFMNKVYDFDLKERLQNFTLLLQISMGLPAYELTSQDLAQLRFEAMHSYFKNLIRIMKNFINPPLSCIKRYETRRASQMLLRPGQQQPQNFINIDDVYTKSRKVK
ncbi:Chitooligosaccharide deacetylase, partial [Frankliniella fusca]